MTKLEKKDFWAINRMDNVQHRLRVIQGEINEMKAELGKAGFKVGINIYMGKTICDVYPKNSKENEDPKRIIRTKAELAEDDYNIPLLGKYLALRRAYAIVILDNKEG